MKNRLNSLCGQSAARDEKTLRIRWIFYIYKFQQLFQRDSVTVFLKNILRAVVFGKFGPYRFGCIWQYHQRIANTSCNLHDWSILGWEGKKIRPVYNFCGPARNGGNFKREKITMKAFFLNVAPPSLRN